MQNQVDTKTCSFSRTLSDDSVKSITAAVNSVAKTLKLSKYMRRKLLKSELADPSDWWILPNGKFLDFDEDDLSIQCFYDAVNDVYSGKVPVDPRVEAALEFKKHLFMKYLIY